VSSYKGFFVDLFVRKSNAVAISMYSKFGYTKYRQVLGYYSGEEDAYGTHDAHLTGVEQGCVSARPATESLCPSFSTDMRKALSRDPEKKSMVPHEPFKVQPTDFS